MKLIAHLQLACALAQDGDPARAQAIVEQGVVTANDVPTRADAAFYHGPIARKMDYLEAAAGFMAKARSTTKR